MTEKQVLDALLERKIVAIVRGVAAGATPKLAQALLDGGISCMEVTFDQTSQEGIRNTLESIRTLSADFPGKIVLGAGTVLSPEQVEQAVEAGATYIISPNVDRDVIRRTKELQAVSMPGAFTPSEVVDAWKTGADIVKLFPAGELGTGYIKAVKAPLAHIPVSAVGGVTPDTLAGFFKAGACGVGVGGNLVNNEAIKAGEFWKITEMARRFSDALAKIV